MKGLVRSALAVCVAFVSIRAGAAGVARADSRLVWAQGDWPGCGGVCALELEEDAVILDIVPELAPDSGVELSLMLFLKEATSGDGYVVFDVSRSKGETDYGAVVLDEVDIESIPGGVANIGSASLVWIDRSSDGAGKEGFEVDP